MVPRGLEDNKAYFRLDCNSADPEGKNKDVDLTNNMVQVDLQILKPDLMVGPKIHHPKNIGNGDIVTISGEISNIGAIEAKEVIVTFYVDGKEIRSQTINVLEMGSTRLVPFTWQGASGEHKLTIRVDPEDAIVEKNENNNENSTKVNSQDSGGFAEIFSNREFCSVLPIIIVVVILAIIIIIIKKRGSFLGLKPGGGEY
jgi:subtilase family serine protease